MIFDALRQLHIASGFTAFFIAPIALVSAKGGRTHRRWGKIYFYAMSVVAASAIILALHRPNYFLAFTSVFSFYLAFSGYRALSRKRPLEGETAAPRDWFAAVLTLACSVALIAMGTLRPTPTWEQIGPVAIAFGSFGALLSSLNLWRFTHPAGDPHGWLFSHIGGMLGSYIGAVTAFSVNNLRFLPLLVRWLWPSAIGVPLIFMWIAYYSRNRRIA
jgi:uncharacterized membrane protein